MAESSPACVRCMSTRSPGPLRAQASFKTRSATGPSKSWIPVRPRAWRLGSTADTAAPSPTSATGTSAPHSAAACSCSSPVGSPAASRTMRPPAGSGVSRVMPQIASAAPFTHSAWKSRLWSSTGRVPLTRSRLERSGAWVQPLASQPRPTSGAPPGSRATNSATRAITSSRLAQSASGTCPAVRAHDTRCTWASTRPGETVAPAASRVRVSGPTSGRSSVSRPSARMRPSATARVSAPARTAPSLQMRAPRTSNSAYGVRPAPPGHDSRGYQRPRPRPRCGLRHSPERRPPAFPWQ